MKLVMVMALAAAVLSSVAVAAPAFFDDFETSNGNWTVWSGAVNLDRVENHAYSPTHSFRASESTTPYAMYANFGATSEALRAEVVLWDDAQDNVMGQDPSRPVNIMLSLWGSTSSSQGYHQLGVFGGGAGDAWEYRIRTRSNAVDTYIATDKIRQAGFTKLAIEADAGAGAQVRYYINEELVGTSIRQGDLSLVRLGSNFGSSYDTIWYDDVRVVPEPASAALMLLGLGALVRRRRRH